MYRLRWKALCNGVLYNFESARMTLAEARKRKAEMIAREPGLTVKIKKA